MDYILTIRIESMDEYEKIQDFTVLKYVKKNKPTRDEFQKHVSVMLYGFEYNQNQVHVYHDKNMIVENENCNLILTGLGETILKDIQSERRKEKILILAPIGALSITTFTLVYSVILGF